MMHQVNGYHADKLDEALDGVKVVVIPAGVPRKVHLYLVRVVTCHLFFFPARRKFTLPAFQKVNSLTSSSQQMTRDDLFNVCPLHFPCLTLSHRGFGRPMLPSSVTLLQRSPASPQTPTSS